MDWKARVTKVSEVESSGQFEVDFEILINGIVKYPRFTVTTISREDLRAKVIEIITRLKSVEFEKVRVKAGDEITI